jgi:hypothetical protein
VGYVRREFTYVAEFPRKRPSPGSSGEEPKA